MQPQYTPELSKQCTQCHETKPLREFHRHARNKDGYRHVCKSCRASNEGFRYRPPARDGYRFCKDCHQEFPATAEYFYPHKDGWLNSYCRPCAIKRARRHYKMNREQYHRLHLKNRFKGRTPERRLYNRLVAPKYHALRKARISALPYSFAPDNERAALEYFGNACAVCGRPAGLFHKIVFDHWIPLSSPDCPGTVPGNMIPLCHGLDGCNNRKHGKEPVEWLRSTFPAEAARILARVEEYFASIK